MRLFRLAGPIGALGFIACAESAGPPGSVGVTGSIAISLSSDAVSLHQGATASVTVNLTRTSFPGDVTLSAQDAPTGVTVTFAPSVLSAGSTQSTVTVSASGSTPAAVSLITIRATATGMSDQTTVLGVTIMSTAPPPAATLSIAPLNATLTAAQLGAASTTVLITRGATLGDVALSASGLPAGVTAAFSAASTSDDAADVTFLTTSDAAPGTYSVIVSASAAGVSSNATIALTIIAPPAKATVTRSWCSFDVPTWVAYRNEGYSWVRVTPVSGAITFEATEKVELAVVWAGPSGTVMRVMFVTRAELAARVPSCPTEAKSLTGTFAGIGPGEFVRIRMGFSTATINADASLRSFTIIGVPDGPVDLIATRRSASGPNKVIVRRALNLPAGSAIPTLDFDTEGHVPVKTNVTLNELAEDANIEVYLHTSSASSILDDYYPTSTTSSASWMPASQLVPGDLQELSLYTDRFLGQLVELRGAFAYYANPADRGISFTPYVPVPTFTAIGRSPYLRMRARLQSQSQYPSVAWMSYSGRSTTGWRTAQVVGTRGYFGGTPATWDMPIPNLSGMGFNPDWMPTQVNTYWVEADSGRTEMLLGGPPVEGDVARWSYHEPFQLAEPVPSFAPLERTELLRRRARSPLFTPK